MYTLFGKKMHVSQAGEWCLKVLLGIFSIYRYSFSDIGIPCEIGSTIYFGRKNC